MLKSKSPWTRSQGDRTRLVIAHRLSTILAVDQILVLLVKQGIHAELIGRGPTCLWETQSGQEPEALGIDPAF